jgi:hypothetical protein
MLATDIPAPKVLGLTTRDAFQAPNILEEVERLGYALAAPAPALFVIWQEAADNVSGFVDACLGAGASEVLTILVKGSDPENLWQKILLEGVPRLSQGAVIVLLGCLSAVAPQRRNAFNAGRNFWMNLGHLVLFVEPIAGEAALKTAFPDIFSLVRDEVKLYSPEPSTEPHACEVERVDESGVVCWVQIGSEERVKVRFSPHLLRHLHPHPGLELVWAPRGKELHPEQFSLHMAPTLPAEDREELQRLRRAFRQRAEQGQLLQDDKE